MLRSVPAHLSSLEKQGFGEEIKLGGGGLWGGEVEIGPPKGQTGLTIWPRIILGSWSSCLSAGLQEFSSIPDYSDLAS